MMHRALSMRRVSVSLACVRRMTLSQHGRRTGASPSVLINGGAAAAVRRCFSTDAPPPPVAPSKSGSTTRAARTDWRSSSPAPSTEAGFAASPRSSRASAPFTMDEVRALTFPLIPLCFNTRGELIREACSTPPSRTAQLQMQLPKALRDYVNVYKRRTTAAGAALPLPCDVRDNDGLPADEKARETATRLLHSGVGGYMVDQFPTELVVVMPGARLARRQPPVPTTDDAVQGSVRSEVDEAEGNRRAPSLSAAAHTGDATGAATEHDAGSATAAPGRSPSASSLPAHPATLSASVSADGGAAHHAELRSTRGATTGQASLMGADTMAPPPPPQPHGRGERYGGGSNAASSLSASSAGSGASATDGLPAPLRTNIQILDALVEYIPTFYAPTDLVAAHFPPAIQALYTDMSAAFFLKRFRHYVDLRTAHGTTDVRLRPNFEHPKRGLADERLRGGSAASVDGINTINQLRRPPRTSEANLIGLIAPQVPREYTPLADVLQEIAPIIARHPAFDSRLGVTGLLGKYPEYFQMVNGELRARPYRVAPNSIAEEDMETSPLPAVYAKVLACVTEAAAGKNYEDPQEKAAAAVSTGRLYSLLAADEKVTVKQRCRSFPTFLRMHGKDLVVSVDKMRVYRFIPEYEACVDTLLNERLRMNSIDPKDPILQIPAAMAEEANASWAVRELYDALPLMQCAELDEVLFLVPPAVRDALPSKASEVRALLEEFPEYFAVWEYPDDPAVIVVQRAKVEQPELDKSAIARMVVPLIPQGGTTLASLRTRAPLVLQRYFHHHGTVKTLSAMKDVFAIAGERIVRMS